MRVKVDCSRDAGGNEFPERLGFDGRTVTVAEVLDRWPGRDHAYFKVKGEDGALYVLRHDEGRGEWELTLFQRGAPSVSDSAGSRGA
jgi:hypothetical protein